MAAQILILWTVFPIVPKWSSDRKHKVYHRKTFGWALKNQAMSTYTNRNWNSGNYPVNSYVILWEKHFFNCLANCLFYFVNIWARKKKKEKKHCSSIWVCFFFFEKLDRAKLRAISHYEIKVKKAFLDFGIIIKSLVLEIESYYFPMF